MEISAIILAVVQLISLYETSEQHLQRVKNVMKKDLGQEIT